ncbi:MAG: EF-P beta-lysylation protein EpmB [Gammaproteobacteria bacterium]|jgi:EF-P beta-lysylation protein EpmB
MIQSSAAFWQGHSWKKALADAIKDPRELFDLLDLPRHYLAAAEEVAGIFPLRVTHSFVARMQAGDIDDPLLLQVLPLHLENQLMPGYNTDPVGDLLASKSPGVIHKYHGRVLLVTTGACAVHCRYCFRRHFPYSAANPAVDDWRQALQYIAGDTSICEVILSGGDPLSLGDQKLLRLVSLLAQIPHVSTLRIHSRLPIVLPQRISETFIARLTEFGLQIIMVIHANHANEINTEVADSLEQMRRYGIPLLNQSVLLRKINDSAPTLAALSRTLFANGVMPYYLHTLDAVQGAAHFAVDRHHTQAMYDELSRLLPGYLLPKLVTEHAGAEYKTPAFLAQGHHVTNGHDQ